MPHQKSNGPDRTVLRRERANLGSVERFASAGAGSALLMAGLRNDAPARKLPMLVGGGYLLYRGLSGHCMVSEALGIRQGGRGVHAGTAVTIERPVEQIYGFWRNFENLPRFMDHLESVRVKADGRSHWVAKGPAGMRVEWDAAVTDERENEWIAWESLTGSDVENGGIVEFKPTPDGRGTEVRVEMSYNPKAGTVGAVLARLFGEEPGQQIKSDLRRLKQVLETGEIATTRGQTSGREAALQEVQP